MAEPALILAFDVPSKALISFDGSPSTFDTLKRGVYLTHIYLRKLAVAALPGISVESSAFDGTSIDGLRVGLWSDSPGTESNQLTLTDQTGWTYNTSDPDNPYFEGYLNLMTTQITAWITSETCKDAFFAVSMVKGADIIPIYDYATCDTENFEIQQQTDPGSGMGTSMTGAVPLITLPLRLLDPESQELYALQRTAAGTLNFVWLNQP